MQLQLMQLPLNYQSSHLTGLNFGLSLSKRNLISVFLPLPRTKPDIVTWWQHSRVRSWTGGTPPPPPPPQPMALHSLPSHQRSPPFHVLTPLERSKSLLDWPEMGDGTPSALLSKMLASLHIGEDPEHILFNALFLRQLPADVQDHLAHSTALTTCQLAEHADAYFALSGARLNQPSPLVGNVYIAAIDCNRQKCSTKTATSLCFYHRRYGKEAKRCTQNNCQMSHIPLATTPPTGNSNAGHQ